MYLKQLSVAELIDLAESDDDFDTLIDLSKYYALIKSDLTDLMPYEYDLFISKLLKNPHLPLVALLNLYAFVQHTEYEKDLNKHPNYLNCDPSDLAGYMYSPSVSRRIGIAAHPKCPSAVLDQLSSDTAYEVRGAVSKNLNTSFYTLLKLAYPFKEHVLKHPTYVNCDVNELLSYKNDSDKNVRSGVALNSKCPPDVLQELSQDTTKDVQLCVLSNSNCPSSVFKRLITAKANFLFRCAAAENKNCPEDLLIKLSKDKDESVRETVGENPRAFDIPQIAINLKALNKKKVDEYEGEENEDDSYLSDILPKNLNAPSHLHKSINTDLELLLALHKYLTRGN